jgi:osmotically-inducible protein OsmY
MRAEAIRRAKTGMLHDDELQHLILERIEEDGSFAVAAGRGRTIINVHVSDGEVTLTGVVRSAADRRRADLLARAMGASSVDNQLRIADDSTGPRGRK